MVGAGDETANGARGGGVRASRADRERVIDALKAAFVRGRLTKDEFELRVGQVLANYAQLDALTADIPAAPAGNRLPEPVRDPDPNRRLIARGTAVGASASMVFVAALVTAIQGNPALGVLVGAAVGSVVAALLGAFLVFLSWVLDGCPSAERSGQLPPHSAPGLP
jgi:hypothetical protein